jgi:membrane-bound serine protease (ClpP class)
VRRLAIALVIVAAVLGSAQLAGAANDDAGRVAPVNVIEVSGYLDRVEVDFINTALDDVVADNAQALVIQLNSKAAVVSDATVARLAERIATSPVPVAIWVGPNGAKAYGASGQMLAAAAVSGMAKGAHIGKFGDPIPVDPTKVNLDFGAATQDLRTRTFGYDDVTLAHSLRPGPNQGQSFTLPLFLASLDGFKTNNGKVLETAEVVTNDKATPEQRTTASPRFFKLPLSSQLMHTVASPPVAYLLLTIGLLLLVFEFYTAGVGVAGVVAAVCLVLACYGIVALPARPWAVALLVLSALAFAIDVQTAVPRFWTGVGIVMYVTGSVWMWDGVSLSWLTLLAGIGGTLLAVLSGMPSMVRTRFATPTIGREWMIGEMGEAVTAVNPDGTVKVREAMWRAHTNRATPLAVGDRVRVVAIDGVMLEVEPETGAARDHRERRRAAPTSE